jgi:hypothetical protein
LRSNAVLTVKVYIDETRIPTVVHIDDGKSYDTDVPSMCSYRKLVPFMSWIAASSISSDFIALHRPLPSS